MKELFTCQYGSHLYGTSTPTSDVDNKVVYLPDLDDVLLGRKQDIFKVRLDATGAPVPDHAQMPDGGVETEYIPFQRFCRDFLNGQTYALEVAFATMARVDCPEWLYELEARFLTCNVSSMVGFAMKQTFDYVHRGVRLQKAQALLSVVNQLLHDERTGVLKRFIGDRKARLDTVVTGQKLLHAVAGGGRAELGTTINNGREMETLKLNGRDYLETTTLEDFHRTLVKLVDSYGHRSHAAGEHEVDRKSLMHAVRVYEQSLELLLTGKMGFPRHNAAELLLIKTDAPLEDVKALLLELEARIEVAQRESKLLPEKTAQMQSDFDEWLLVETRKMYGLSAA
jgi:hypothetical protein